MFYSIFTRFVEQVRNRCSRSTCPAWFAVIPTRCYRIPEPPLQKREIVFAPPHKWTPFSRAGKGLGMRASKCQGPQVRLRYDPTATKGTFQNCHPPDRRATYSGRTCVVCGF